MTLRDDINTAIRESHIKDFHFVRLTLYQDLLDRIADHFLVQGRSDLKYVWLWERFSDPKVTYDPKDATKLLEQQLPKDQDFWFLASDEDGKYWVSEGKGESIINVIKGMYCFEYYIVEKKLRWILCENHHGILIQSGTDGILNGSGGVSP